MIPRSQDATHTINCNSAFSTQYSTNRSPVLPPPPTWRVWHGLVARHPRSHRQHNAKLYTNLSFVCFFCFLFRYRCYYVWRNPALFHISRMCMFSFCADIQYYNSNDTLRSVLTTYKLLQLKHRFARRHTFFGARYPKYFAHEPLQVYIPNLLIVTDEERMRMIRLSPSLPNIAIELSSAYTLESQHTVTTHTCLRKAVMPHQKLRIDAHIYGAFGDFYDNPNIYVSWQKCCKFIEQLN